MLLVDQSHTLLHPPQGKADQTSTKKPQKSSFRVFKKDDPIHKSSAGSDKHLWLPVNVPKILFCPPPPLAPFAGLWVKLGQGLLNTVTFIQTESDKAGGSEYFQHKHFLKPPSGPPHLPAANRSLWTLRWPGGSANRRSRGRGGKTLSDQSGEEAEADIRWAGASRRLWCAVTPQMWARGGVVEVMDPTLMWSTGF